MAENGADLPIVNFERISETLSIFKLPLILASIGILLTVFSLILIFKPSSKSEGIVFSTDASSSAKTKIRVDVVGSLNKPGVYEFIEGDRVSDAISVAGGLRDEADRDWIEKNINRAAKLVDGGKIYIPSTKDSVEGKIQNPNIKNQNEGSNLLGVTTGFININSASQSELEALPGVGPVTAGKIISGRPYQTIDELKTKNSVGNALFDKIKDKLSI